MTSIDKDPTQLKWALGDLEDFSDSSWNGGDILIPAPTVEKIRKAASVVLSAVANEILVPSDPIREALSLSAEDNEGYLARIEQLSRDRESLLSDNEARLDEMSQEIVDLKTQIETLRKDKGVLEKVIMHSTDDLGDIEFYGDVSDNPIALIISHLNDAMSETSEIEPIIS